MPVTYEDILAKLGMQVQNGQLLLNSNQTPSTNPNPNPNSYNKVPVQQPAQYSYIYNKHFKDYIQPEEPQRPQDPIELRNQLLREYIHKKRMEQIKTHRISYQQQQPHYIDPQTAPFPSYTNVNRLFTFAKK